MQRESTARLFDILGAAREIRLWSAGRTVDDLLADGMYRSAVERHFITIGEAMAMLRRDDAALFERISEGTRIIGFRNQLVHGYSDIRHETTWRIITTKLPILIAEIEPLIPPSPG